MSLIFISFGNLLAATLQTDHVYFTLKRRGEQPFPRRFN